MHIDHETISEAALYRGMWAEVIEVEKHDGSGKVKRVIVGWPDGLHERGEHGHGRSSIELESHPHLADWVDYRFVEFIALQRNPEAHRMKMILTEYVFRDCVNGWKERPWVSPVSSDVKPLFAKPVNPTDPPEPYVEPAPCST